MRKFILFVLPLSAFLAASACGGSPTAPPTSCTFSLGQTTTTFGSAGGSASIAVAAGSGCAWTAVSNASFISVTQGATGSGNGTVQFAVAANAGAQRSGTLTIGGNVLTITQTEGTVAPVPVTLSAPAPKTPINAQLIATLQPALEATNSVAGGNAGTVTYRFEVSELESFQEGSRTSAQDGIAQGSGTTSWQITRNLVANLLYYWRARATNGTVTSDWSTVATFRTPCIYTLSTLNVSVPMGGGSSSVGVSAGGTCAWSAMSNASFITITSGAGATGDGTVMFSVAANGTGSARSGTLTIAGQTVTVMQD